MTILRENNLAKKYPALKKKYLAWPITLEKNLTQLNVVEKILSPEFWGKNPYPNQITHTPPQKLNGRPLTYFGLQWQ